MNIAVWKCKTCGCMWRDNLDDTLSLLDQHQKSCCMCETMPTHDVCYIHWLKLVDVSVMRAIPVSNDLRANRYDSDDEHVLHLWVDGQSFDIRSPK